MLYFSVLYVLCTAAAPVSMNKLTHGNAVLTVLIAEHATSVDCATGRLTFTGPNT